MFCLIMLGIKINFVWHKTTKEGWFIHSFGQYVNPSRVIWWLEVRESHSLYVPIYIFVQFFSEEVLFAHGLIKYE